MVDNIYKELESRRLINSEYRIIRWPKKNSDKILVLGYIYSKIERNRKYCESEINHIILRWQIFEDYALIRRELFERGYLNRTNNCKEYWI